MGTSYTGTKWAIEILYLFSCFFILPLFMSNKLQEFKDALINDGGIEEKVEVNQRHLIDKILARYSATYTIFRELLQNSNDANAESIQISFETTNQNSTGFQFPWSKKENVSSVTYKNNGKPFSEDDFARLRKIAEGNPDEQKIGFFGVGFYSLFSICEEPFVSSGGQTMGFFWKKDMLYTKRGKLPEDSVDQWTIFFLPTRELIELPETKDFANFLATCLAFAMNIKDVEVFVDGERILHFSRKFAPPKPLEFSKSIGYQSSSPYKLFKLIGVETSQIQLDMEIVERGNSKNFTVHMKVASATLKVSLPSKIETEMYRTTKKQPPKTSVLQIVSTNFEEYDSTLQTIKGAESIFENLIPSPGNQGRIFIGFPTHQTTSCSVHIAGHFIPTVERESIDFVDKTLYIWNTEYLSMCGMVCRVVFDLEMNTISTLLEHMEMDDKRYLTLISSDWFYRKVAHNLRSFFFRPSTPYPIVGQTVQSAFVKATDKPLLMISSNGKLEPINVLRLPPLDSMGLFIKTIPTIPFKFKEMCPEVVQFYQTSGLLKNISIDDVLLEISSRALNKVEMVGFFEYWIGMVKMGNITDKNMGTLQKNLTYVSDLSTTVSLSKMFFISNQKIVPNTLPLPSTCIPNELTKSITKSDLELAFWGWRELDIITWAQFIVQHQDFVTDVKFTESVMLTFSRHYSNMSKEQHQILISILSVKSCIPTQNGMKLPTQAYLETVNLFDDIPKIAFESKSMNSQFLKHLGVRDHVELQMVFDRIHDLSWDQTQLIKYFGTIVDKLTSQEWKTLKETALFVAANDNKRYKANELYAPILKLKDLGLKTIFWHGKWKAGNESLFMDQLGLRNVVPLMDLLKLVANSPVDNRLNLIQFMVKNFEDYTHQYSSDQVPAFLPIQGSDALVSPTQCYYNGEVSCMNFSVLLPALSTNAALFGVKECPTGDQFLQALKSYPPNLDNADLIFSFLSSRQMCFSNRNWNQLRIMEFIPVKTNTGVRLMAPSKIYFKTKDSMYENTFVYVLFSQNANVFLKACGVQEEPTPFELAAKIVQEPELFFTDDYAAYIDILRQIAVNFPTISRDTALVEKMKRSQFLIAISSREGGKLTYHLNRASEIYLSDDAVLKQLFQPLW
jgi:hypothetical protein